MVAGPASGGSFQKVILVAKDEDGAYHEVLSDSSGSIGGASYLDGVETLLTSISGFVDGIETSLTSLLASRSAVTYTHSAVGATGSSAQLVASNASRKFLLIQNVSDSVVAIAFQNGTPDVTAASEDGILIAAGGNYEISLARGNLDTSRVNVIAPAATKRVLVTEGV